MKACWLGQCLDLTICIYRSLGDLTGPVGPNNKSLVINMERAYITEYNITPGAEEGGTEEIKVVYNYIQYAFAELDFAQGKLKSARQAVDWNWTTNEITAKLPSW